MTTSTHHYHHMKPRLNATIMRKGGAHRTSRKTERQRAKCETRRAVREG